MDRQLADGGTSVAGDADRPAKNNTIRNLVLALSGLIAGIVGVGVGLSLSDSAPVENPETHSVQSENPQNAVKSSAESPKQSISAPDGSHAAESNLSEAAVNPLNDQMSPVPIDAGMQSFAAGDTTAVPSRLTHVALADEELRAGNYARAIRIYQAALDKATGVEEAALRYRLALCAESSGDFSEAQQQYQALASRFAMLTWVNAARLGEARCIAALGRLDGLIEGTLRQALMDQTSFPQRVRGELFHLAGRACCQSFLSTDIAGILDDQVLIMPLWVTDPNRQLNMLPVVLKEQPTEPGSVGFEILQQTDRLPDSIYIRASTPVSDLKRLLEAVCRRSGFTCEFSESALLAVSRRTQQVHVTDMSFSLILDGLCAPFGMLWQHSEGQISIKTSEEVQSEDFLAYRRQLGERLLKSALILAPESQQSSYSRVALGILQHRNNATAEAAHTFQMQMELEPRSEVEAEAALNLGKCRLALKQYPEAHEAFLTAVDSPSHHLHARVGAYLYVARLQIENGEFQPAVSSLVRSLAMSRGTSFEPQAAAMLGSAYLLAGSPQGTSSILMERRETLQQLSNQTTAAFLSSYARFQGAVLPGPQERAARTLVTALTRFKADGEFGAHWEYLRAQACRELGLTQEAADGYLKTIQKLPATPLRDRAMLQLANHYRYENQLDEASRLLSGISGRNESFDDQIAMQAALVALKRGKPAEAVKQCRFIVESTDDDVLQRSALKAMGQAYEMQQDYRSAVYCYAGMLPDSVADDDKTDAATARSRDNRESRQ